MINCKSSGTGKKLVYELHYIQVKKNNIPQVIITVPYNCDKEFLNLFTLALLYKIIKDTIEPTPEFKNYEDFLKYFLS